jgi:ketosteroid isomerase-like protein
MSQGQPSHEEIVTRAFESFRRLNLDGFTSEWHPDVVWDVSGYDGWPEEKTQYKGTHEVLDGFAHYLAGAKGFETSGHEVIAIDDKRVLGLHHERRIDENDVPVDIEIGVLYEFDDGQVIRAQVFTGHAQAREAAGV